MATPKNFIATSYVGTAAATAYTANNVRAVLNNFTATNISGASATLTVHILRGGASVSDENIIIKARNFQAGESAELGAKMRKALDNADAIAVFASVADAITIDACGVEYSL